MNLLMRVTNDTVYRQSQSNSTVPSRGYNFGVGDIR
jgi:hypothetical protein